MFSSLFKIRISSCVKLRRLFPTWISRVNYGSKKQEGVSIQSLETLNPKQVCNPQFLMDPKNKVAIITGGETGIGFAAANDLLKNGAKVVVLAGVGKGNEAVQKLNREHGQDRVCFMHMDVNDESECEELFYRVDSVFGGVDILFNNAGIMQDCVWEFEVDTNFKSVMRATLLGLDYLGKKCNKNGEGVIINHSDVVAVGSFPFAPCYAATKAAIVSASRSFGAPYHYKQTGVRVIGLLSGLTDTNLLRIAGDKQYYPRCGRDLAAYIQTSSTQSPWIVGKAVTYLVKFAPSGTLWTAEDGQLFNTEIPNRHDFNSQVLEFK